MPTPTLRPPETVAVLGAGNMGSGIAQACAQAGFSVVIRDLNDDLLVRGQSLISRTLQGAIGRGKLTAESRDEVISRLTFTTSLRESVGQASLVIEAVFEELDVKKALFREIAEYLQPETIVATNTSSLSISELQAEVPNPSRFAGLHFFYPAAVNRLVEVVGGASTSSEVLDLLESFSSFVKKTPIRVKDSAGFAVNRYFVPYLNEATRMASENLASLATIEEGGRELFGTTLGPFELMNVTGVPIAFHSETSLARAFGPAYLPTPLLEERFRSGTPWNWKETNVEPEKKALVRDRFSGLVFGITTRMVDEKVASAEAIDRGAMVGLRWKRGPFGMMAEVGLSTTLKLVEQYAAPWGDAFPVSAELRTRAAAGEHLWPVPMVRVERAGSVAWVLLDRPEVLNAPNSELLRQLDAAFLSLEPDPDLRVVVLAGSSPVFAAGADISAMAQKDVREGRAFGFEGQAVCRRIEEFRTPVIALVEGYALGGGLELALACDFIVAAESAKLGLPEVTVGIHPGWGGASRLTRLIGRARTKYLVYTGDVVSAQEAERLGVVASLVPDATAREEVRQLAERIASRAPLGVQWVKSVVNRGADSSLDAALRLEGESAGHTFATRDRTEGMKAFLERRKPQFEGR